MVGVLLGAFRLESESEGVVVTGNEDIGCFKILTCRSPEVLLRNLFKLLTSIFVGFGPHLGQSCNSRPKNCRRY
jgi:hypothetical protein